MKLMTGNKERKDMRRIGMAVLMVVIFTGGAGAQQKVLTFAEAVRIAMQNSVALNTQRNNLEVNQMFKTASYVSMGPNVSLNASAVRIDGNSFNPQTGTVINGIRDNITGSVNANINLFSGFQTINTIKQNNQLTDAQAYNVSRTTQDVINTVAAPYLNVMLDKELLRIAKQNFDALSQQLTQVSEQAALGSRSPVDEYNQEAQTKAIALQQERVVSGLALGPHLRARAGVLSRGERHRVAIAEALLLRRPLTVLDEPLAAFDPLQRTAACDLLRELARAGHALLMTVHEMHTAERIADRIVLLHEGRVLAVGTLAELRAAVGRETGDLEDIFVALLSKGRDAA